MTTQIVFEGRLPLLFCRYDEVKDQTTLVLNDGESDCSDLQAVVKNPEGIVTHLLTSIKEK